MNLSALLEEYRRLSVTDVLVKPLAENDNSKNQIYLEPSWDALNALPIVRLTPEPNGTAKAALDFSWIDEEGAVSPAPHAQLILYPQYPEVRLSGFLLGCRTSPNHLFRGRGQHGRWLVLGVARNGRIFAHAVSADSALAHDLRNAAFEGREGIFLRLSVDSRAYTRSLLLDELERIHDAGWLPSRRLSSNRSSCPCLSSNCGGYTLEAELGITPNGASEPDYLGWEVKQHAVASFDRAGSRRITLMTPEPTGGYYRTHGVEAFVRRYGYEDTLGREDRLNFGGQHRYGTRNPRTLMTLALDGYDELGGAVTDMRGGIVLLDECGAEAAVWHFSSLLEHWNRKHAQAVYVPSKCRVVPSRYYQFGPLVRLGEGTNFGLFLSAVHAGHVVYDPGLKLEDVSSGRPRSKRRSQFRIPSGSLPCLYSRMTLVDVHSRREAALG